MISAQSFPDDSAELSCECGWVFLARLPGEGTSHRCGGLELAAEISTHWIHVHGEWLIKCTGQLPGRRAPYVPAGQWLEDYQPDALGGYGKTAWTLDPGRAMRFVSQDAAARAWSTASALGRARHPAPVLAVEFVPSALADTGPAAPGNSTQEGGSPHAPT